MWVTVWLVYKSLDAGKAGKLMRIFVLSLFLISATIVYGVRLQLLLLLGAALLRYIGGSTWSYGKRVGAYAAIFVLGNNLHGGYLILAIIPLLMEWQRVLDGKRTQREWLQLGGIALVLAASTFCSPYGMDFWRLTWDYLRDPYYKQYINEWKPVFSPPVYWFSGVPVFVFITFVGMITAMWRRLPVSEILLLAIFGYLGLAHLRFFPLFILLFLPHLVQGLRSVQAGFPDHQSQLRGAAIALLGILVFSRVIFIDYSSLSVIAQVETAPNYPYAAMRYLEQQGTCKTGLFNSYAWGGYITGFYPDVRVFIDGRGPQLKVSGNTTILQEYRAINAERDPQKLGNMLRMHSVNCALVETPPLTDGLTYLDRLILTPQDRNEISHENSKGTFPDHLRANPQWKVVYSDSTATLLTYQPQ